MGGDGSPWEIQQGTAESFIWLRPPASWGSPKFYAGSENGTLRIAPQLRRGQFSFIGLSARDMVSAVHFVQDEPRDPPSRMLSSSNPPWGPRSPRRLYFQVKTMCLLQCFSREHARRL